MAHPISRAVLKFQTAAVRLQKTREKDALANRYAPLLTEFFKKQESSFMFRLEFASRLGPITLQVFYDIWDGILIDTNPELQKIVARIQGESLIQGAKQAKGQFRGLEERALAPALFDPGKSFTLENPRAVAWFKKYGGSVKLIKDIQDTTKAGIKSLITKGIKEGWSYGQMATAVKDLFDEPISNRRAKLISVTESARAYEAGNRTFAESLKDDGVKMEKMWMTSHDDRVSDGCQANEDAGWVPMDYEYPEEMVTEPPRFPGCRCYEIYREAE